MCEMDEREKNVFNKLVYKLKCWPIVKFKICHILITIPFLDTMGKRCKIWIKKDTKSINLLKNSLKELSLWANFSKRWSQKRVSQYPIEILEIGKKNPMFNQHLESLQYPTPNSNIPTTPHLQRSYLDRNPFNFKQKKTLFIFPPTILFFLFI
jgi:hypothetical protein